MEKRAKESGFLHSKAKEYKEKDLNPPTNLNHLQI
jgi:hypothetical protein